MLDFISQTVENQPKIFGTLHFIILAIFVLLIVLICIFLRHTNEKQNKIILLFFGLWLLFFEILKQVLLIYDQGNFKYDWQHLPLQPCSALMYTIILAGFLSTNKKAKKFEQFLYAFIGIFGFFSGASAIVMPSSIFSTNYILLLFQTSQHHMVLALLAVYLFVSGRVSPNFKNFLKSVAVFVFWCATAFILNVVLFAITKNPEINLMYIGPYTIWSIPIISDFIKIDNPWAFIPFYIFIYSLACLLSMYVYLCVAKIVAYIHGKITKNKQDVVKRMLEIIKSDF